MEKTDLMKQYKSEYTARRKPVLITAGPAVYLSIGGKGDPDGPEFARKVQALYVAAYAIKFFYKSKGSDFVVSRLEGLWWFDEKKYGHYHFSEVPAKVPRAQWFYRLLIRMPGQITAEAVNSCIDQVRAKKQLADLKEVRLIEMEEGKCVQVLHTGPFDKEPQSLELIRAYMEGNGLEQNGLHHEIYLSDFRKTSPDKLRTILREPVKKARPLRIYPND